ncbi:hypothetical protein BS47DRAFT_602620 [Hydnum rufescens UP504]|uniref:Uncharacterized protein n=1 Tax=Hydnum rufescens UP504 TaxID=1448309 RepID=A0A9P6DZI3_9AGAM|nr:hypothetical protein BS47DRAFT_602620 [Hydnum rufescens UP504]
MEAICESRKFANVKASRARQVNIIACFNQEEVQSSQYHILTIFNLSIPHDWFCVQLRPRRLPHPPIIQATSTHAEPSYKLRYVAGSPLHMKVYLQFHHRHR